MGFLLFKHSLNSEQFNLLWLGHFRTSDAHCNICIFCILDCADSLSMNFTIIPFRLEVSLMVAIFDSVELLSSFLLSIPDFSSNNLFAFLISSSLKVDKRKSREDTRSPK